MRVNKSIASLIVGILILNPSIVFAQACETTIDGHCRLDVDIVDYEGVPAPSVSPLGKGRRYFDATANTFKCSENGAAFVDCDGDTGAGNPGGAVTQVQFHDTGGVFGGDSGFTFNKTTDVLTLSSTSSKFVAIASPDRSITAAAGITVTNKIMRVVGSGGAIDITANPQIAAPADTGATQVTFIIVQGTNDTNTVKLDDGTGLALCGGTSMTLGKNDNISLMYDSGESEWLEHGGRCDLN